MQVVFVFMHSWDPVEEQACSGLYSESVTLTSGLINIHMIAWVNRHERDMSATPSLLDFINENDQSTVS